MSGVYYNEIDSFAAAWLRELMKAGQIPDGAVDERSITDVRADDLRGFRQCHFFAGIGGWAYALRLAGWPDEREVWTGSCPCQPFSAAGKGAGTDDSRDLWPAWFGLIRERRPLVCFGEQVASADGLGWFDRVSADMEAANYAIAAVDLCAPSIGAYHIRQRLWFVADSECAARRSIAQYRANDLDEVEVWTQGSSRSRERGAVGGMADTDEHQSSNGELQRSGRFLQPAEDAPPGFWSACDWIPCRDGKARPVEPGTFPLAHGVSARVGRLRGYGNAIVPALAAEFIKAYREAIGEDLHGM